jgi:maleate isomerase
MPDRYGPRGVVAVVIPIQNSNMQPEYEAMRPAGVSNQIYRFWLEGDGDTPMAAAIRVIPDTLKCWPDTIIVGNSVEMRNVSVATHLRYRARLQEAAGDVRVVTAAEACEAALRTLGARRVGLLNPMFKENSESAAVYYRELGFEVPAISWLDIDKPEKIIGVQPEQIAAVFSEIAGPEVDALLHVGGALGVVDMLDDLENELGNPIVSVNAATYWYALRLLGVLDPIPGFGQLLTRTGITGQEPVTSPG